MVSAESGNMKNGFMQMCHNPWYSRTFKRTPATRPKRNPRSYIHWVKMYECVYFLLFKNFLYGVQNCHKLEIFGNNFHILSMLPVAMNKELWLLFSKDSLMICFCSRILALIWSTIIVKRAKFCQKCMYESAVLNSLNQLSLPY